MPANRPPTPGETVSGQAFADDANTVSESAAGLQALVRVMWRHSIEWLWDASVIKSHVVIFNPDASAPPPCIHFGDNMVPVCTEMKNLGLVLTEHLSWLPQLIISRMKRKGYAALQSARRPLRSRGFSFRTKRHVVAGYIVPSMRFGLELWSPRTAAERGAFAALDNVLLDAMHTILGLHKGPDKWHYAQRLKADVLFHDFALPRMRWEHDIAHTRFRF